MMKKITFSALLTAVLLSGCTGVGVNGSGVSVGLGLGGMIGNHVGLGTSINIPLTFDKTNTSSSSSNTGGINITEEKIITYFDTQGKATDSAVMGGYHRKLISKQSDGFLVQDFYSTGEKRTDPMVLPRETVFDFRAHPKDGSHTVYAINGNVMQQHVYKNNAVVK